MFPAKGSYGTDCQLHTVIEKSPESSPTTKPRQGGAFPPSPPEPSSAPADASLQSGRLIFTQGAYPGPQPEPPHYAQMPISNPAAAGSSAACPSLSKESGRRQHQGLQGGGGKDDGVTEGQRDGKISTTENRHQNNISVSQCLQSSYMTSASSKLRTPAHEADR